MLGRADVHQILVRIGLDAVQNNWDGAMQDKQARDTRGSGRGGFEPGSDEEKEGAGSGGNLQGRLSKGSEGGVPKKERRKKHNKSKKKARRATSA